MACKQEICCYTVHVRKHRGESAYATTPWALNLNTQKAVLIPYVAKTIKESRLLPPNERHIRCLPVTVRSFRTLLAADCARVFGVGDAQVVDLRPVVLQRHRRRRIATVEVLDEHPRERARRRRAYLHAGQR